MQTLSPRKTSQAWDSKESSSRSFLIRSWLATYAETYRDRNGLPRDVSDGRLGQIYEKALGDIPTEQLAAALERALKTCRFFPTPADIRAQIDQLDEQGRKLEAEHAWQHALGWIGRYYHPDIEISRGAPELSPKITHAIRAAGGMRMLSNCEEANLVWRKKDFLADYMRNEELGRSEHLLTDGEAKRILATLLAGPPPKYEQLAPARAPSTIRPSKSEVRAAFAEVRAVLDKAPLAPAPTVDTMSDEELERQKREQKERLAAWEATRAKNAARVAT